MNAQGFLVSLHSLLLQYPQRMIPDGREEKPKTQIIPYVSHCSRWVKISDHRCRTILAPSTNAQSLSKATSRGRYFMPQSGARISHTLSSFIIFLQELSGQPAHRALSSGNIRVGQRPVPELLRKLALEP